jgi:DNA-binding transcriptional LysR family regulator
MDDEIAGLAPNLERILPDELQVTFPVWLVTHREIHTSPRIRLVYDLLAEGLG